MSHFLSKKLIGLVGGCIEYGQQKKGVELAPAYLRESGLLEVIRKHHLRLVDFGNTSSAQPQARYEELSTLARRSSSLCDFSLILGGDHSQAIGSAHGILKHRPQTKTIWIDAHGDMNTPASSPSGNLHGMPLAALMGLFDLAEQMESPWFEPMMKPESLALLGVRDLDETERETMERLGIFHLTAEEVLDMGSRQAMLKTLQAIDPWGISPLHLSVDVDCLSSEYMSVTGLPVANGLSPDLLFEMSSEASATSRLKSLEVVELNPLLAQSEKELQSATSIVLNLIDQVLESLSAMSERGPLPKMNHDFL